MICFKKLPLSQYFSDLYLLSLIIVFFFLVYKADERANRTETTDRAGNVYRYNVNRALCGAMRYNVRPWFNTYLWKTLSLCPSLFSAYRIARKRETPFAIGVPPQICLGHSWALVLSGVACEVLLSGNLLTFS